MTYNFSFTLATISFHLEKKLMQIFIHASKMKFNNFKCSVVNNTYFHVAYCIKDKNMI